MLVLPTCSFHSDFLTNAITIFKLTIKAENSVLPMTLCTCSSRAGYELTKCWTKMKSELAVTVFDRDELCLCKCTFCGLEHMRNNGSKWKKTVLTCTKNNPFAFYEYASSLNHSVYACMYMCVYHAYLQGQTSLYLSISVFSVAHSIQKMLDHSK